MQVVIIWRSKVSLICVGKVFWKKGLFLKFLEANSLYFVDHPRTTDLDDMHISNNSSYHSIKSVYFKSGKKYF